MLWKEFQHIQNNKKQNSNEEDKKMFNQMKIRTKLLGGFLLVAIVTGIIGFIGYIGMQKVLEGQNEMTEVFMPGVNNLQIILSGQRGVMLGERGLINYRMMDKELRKAQYTYIDEAWKKIDEARKIFEALPKTKEEADEWKNLLELQKLWKNIDQKVNR